MNRTPAIDTRSPWYEAFAPAAGPSTRWLAATRFPALAAEQAVGGGAETPPAAEKQQAADEQWVTAALFDCYNA
jgi:hypothetical protein